MGCAYCGQDKRKTKEHIISDKVLDLFEDSDKTFDYYVNLDENTIGIMRPDSDPVIRDVCAQCNNGLSYVDEYAVKFIKKYFSSDSSCDDTDLIEYDYTMVQKFLLKYAYNAMRRHGEDCSFFDDKVIDFLLHKNNSDPLPNVSILGGIVSNDSLLPIEHYGDFKILWSRNPRFLANPAVYFDCLTQSLKMNENVQEREFEGLELSYIFRFNNVQFILLCWNENKKNIDSCLSDLTYHYPYKSMKPENENCNSITLPYCTNGFNVLPTCFKRIHLTIDRANILAYTTESVLSLKK